MANQVYANNASAVLASGITDSDLSLSVSTGQGTLFPSTAGSNYFYVTIYDNTNTEIVKVTSKTSDTFTIVRAQEGTTARAFSANSLVELRITAKTLENLRDVATQTSGTISGVNATLSSLTTTAVPQVGGAVSYSMGIGVDALDNITTGGSYCTAVGIDSQKSNDTCTKNTSVGYGSMYSAYAVGGTPRGQNTAVGHSSMYYMTGAANNTAVGANTLNTNTLGDNNTAIGTNALFDLNGSAAEENVAVGVNACWNMTTGWKCTGIGSYALQAYTGAGPMTAVGHSALYSATTNVNCTAVGYKALYAATGSNNVAMGTNAGLATSTGTLNTIVGTGAMTTNTSGGNNVAVGANALFSAGTVSNNVALGSAALYYATGAGNIGIGRDAGDTITNGTNNVIIGNGADVDSATITNAIAIGAGAVARYSNSWTIGAIGTVRLIEEGTNAAAGVATLVGGTVTVSTTAIPTGARIRLDRQTAGGTLGHLSVASITPGVSFIINSSSATETSDIYWEVLGPSPAP